MNDDVLTHLRALGVQVFLHPQRAFVATLNRARAGAETRVAELQLGVPTRGKQDSGDR